MRASPGSHDPYTLRYTAAMLGRRAHRAHELEIVVVGIGERGDPARAVAHLVGLADHRRAGRLEPLELTLHVGRLEPPDHAARLLIRALDLIVGSERDAGV